MKAKRGNEEQIHLWMEIFVDGDKRWNELKRPLADAWIMVAAGC